MTDEMPALLSIVDANKRVIFKITQTEIWVAPELNVSEAAEVVVTELGKHIHNAVLKGIEQQVMQLQATWLKGIEQQVMQLQATCWQLQQERNALAAQLQATTPSQKLDS